MFFFHPKDSAWVSLVPCTAELILSTGGTPCANPSCTLPGASRCSQTHTGSPVVGSFWAVNKAARVPQCTLTSVLLLLSPLAAAVPQPECRDREVSF